MRAAILFLLLFLPAWAKPVYFEYPVGRPTPEEQKALDLAADFMANYYRHLGYSLPGSVRINLFPNLQAHMAYQQQVAASVRTRYSNDYPILATSFYDPNRKEICTWRKLDLQQTLIHETSHAMFGFANRPPTWLNEGMSELFGNMSFPNGRPNIEPQPDKIAELTANFHNGKLGQGVMRVVDLPYLAFHREDIEADNYRNAWAVVYFLHRSRKLEGMIPRILQNNNLDQNNSQTLSLAYLGGMQALVRQMELFYRTEFPSQ